MTAQDGTFYMAKRLCEQRSAIAEFFFDSTRHHLGPEQWVLLNAIVAVLEPFEEATQILSMDTATLGQVLPLLKFIENILSSMKETSAEGTVSFNLSAALLSELQASRHLNMIRDDVDYWTASFLDPRFKETLEHYIIDPEGKRRVHDHLIAQVVANTRPSFPQPSMTQPPNSDSQRVPASSPLSSRNAGLWSKHSEKMGLTTKKEQRAGSHTSRDDTAVVKLELNGYVQDDSDHNACSDPLLYWSNTKDRLPCLFAVASHYLACPPTSVYSERVFSNAGCIVTCRRNRL
ncbi:hypothetical protein HPB47_015757, partial [Ixodes persulcatus]